MKKSNYKSKATNIIYMTIGVIILSIVFILSKGPNNILNFNNNGNEYKQRQGTISFEENNYVCKAGQTFETVITAESSSNIATVKSYSSSNTNIASVDDNVSEVPMCINCKAIRVVCHKEGTVKLTATSSTGARTTAKLTVNQELGTISFKERIYTCKAGQTFETVITAESSSNIATVKSYSSNDTNIASVDDNVSEVPKCTNCKAIRVICHREGTVDLTATSSTGVRTTAKLTVTQDLGSISFKESSYSCKAGQSFETIITATNSSNNATVKTYESSNESIASIDDNVSEVPKCYNCKAIRVVCHKAGNVNLSAISSTGAQAIVKLTVNQDVGKISFKESSYSCKAGQSFETIITATNSSNNATVKTYMSSNTSIASVDENVTKIPKCYNCKAIRVVCHKAGSINLSAISSTGAQAIVKLTVSQDIGNISFKESSYSCNVGQTFETIITATNSSNNATVKTYSSSNASIASVDDNVSEVPKCYNCKAIRVICHKEGTVKLTATSSTGAQVTANLTVNTMGTISFRESSYACIEGESFQTTIIVSKNATVKSYTSSNTTIASIIGEGTTIGGCTNCKTIVVACHKEGTVKLTATSSTGAKATANLTVNSKGTISFKESSYSCKVGETFETIITANPYDATVKTYTSSNTSIASVDDNVSEEPRCYNCKAIRVICKKEGIIKLTATSSKGAKATVTLTVQK